MGVRLITVDRPGYGGSDPVADPTLSGFRQRPGPPGRPPVAGAVPGGGMVGRWPVRRCLRSAAGGAGQRARPGGDAGARCRGPLAVAFGPGPGPHGGDRSAEALAAATDIEARSVADAHRAGERWDSPSDITTRRQPQVDRALRDMWREGLRNGAQGWPPTWWPVRGHGALRRTQMATPAQLFYGDDDVVVGLKHGAVVGADLAQRQPHGDQRRPPDPFCGLARHSAGGAAMSETKRRTRAETEHRSVVTVPRETEPKGESVAGR